MATMNPLAMNPLAMNPRVIIIKNKNIKLYRSPIWLYCVVKINNICYKYIHADELSTEKAYTILTETRENVTSLLCDNMIIYQRPTLFGFTLEFTLEFTMANVDGEEASTDSTFYKYI
jgi:hypothetical protein